MLHQKADRETKYVYVSRENLVISIWRHSQLYYAAALRGTADEQGL